MFGNASIDYVEIMNNFRCENSEQVFIYFVLQLIGQISLRTRKNKNGEIYTK